MRRIYLTLGILAISSYAAIAQNFNVTFQVDMSTQGVVDDTVSVAGNFQVAAGFPSDWTPGVTLLTDNNIDGVYDVTVTLPAGSYEYKFLNGAQWGTDEGVPGACAVNVTNREVIVTGNIIIPVVCFGACGACTVGNEPSKEDVVEAAPVPSSDRVMLRLPESYLGSTFRVFSAEGRVVNQGVIHSTSLELNLSAWESGLYLIRWEEEQFPTVKLMRQ